MPFTKSLVAVVCSSFMLAGAAIPNDGQATWFNPGLGNCGAYNSDVDFVVALSSQEYNNGAHCWQRVQVYHNGTTIDALVADSCPGCLQYSIDLSQAAFQALAPLDEGVIPVTWWYV